MIDNVVEDGWKRSPTSANYGVDRGFINKEYISNGMRLVGETKTKATRAYAQRGLYHTTVEVSDS